MELSTLDLNKMSTQELIKVVEMILQLATHESERVEALQDRILALEMKEEVNHDCEWIKVIKDPSSVRWMPDDHEYWHKCLICGEISFE